VQVLQPYNGHSVAVFDTPVATSLTYSGLLQTVTDSKGRGVLISDKLVDDLNLVPGWTPPTSERAAYAGGKLR
jgi:hypothetical protein